MLRPKVTDVLGLTTGIRGIWSLKASSMDAYDTYLVLTFVGETRVLAITPDDELDEAELSGFDAEAQVHPCNCRKVPDLAMLHVSCACVSASSMPQFSVLSCTIRPRCRTDCRNSQRDMLPCLRCRACTAATRRPTRSCRSRGSRCGS